MADPKITHPRSGTKLLHHPHLIIVGPRLSDLVNFKITISSKSSAPQSYDKSVLLPMPRVKSWVAVIKDVSPSKDPYKIRVEYDNRPATSVDNVLFKPGDGVIDGGPGIDYPAIDDGQAGQYSGIDFVAYGSYTPPNPTANMSGATDDQDATDPNGFVYTDGTSFWYAEWYDLPDDDGAPAAYTLTVSDGTGTQTTSPFKMSPLCLSPEGAGL